MVGGQNENQIDATHFEELVQEGDWPANRKRLRLSAAIDKDALKV